MARRRALRRAVALPLALGLALQAGAAAAHDWTLLAQIEREQQEPPFDPAPGVPLIPLRITLRDPASGAEIAGSVRVLDENARPLRLDLLAERPRGWYAVPGAVEVLAPAARLEVEAFQGLETVRVVRELDLRGQSGAEIELPLARFVSARDRGLVSGNTHLHVMGWTRPQVEEYLRTAAAADQLDLAFVSYLLRHDSDTPYTSNELGRAELEALSTPSARFGWGEELRHNSAPYVIGYGHVLLLDLRTLIEPASIGPFLNGDEHDFPGLAPGLAAARTQGGTVIWAHGRAGYEDLPSWLLGRVDAQNLFDGAEPSEIPRGDHESYARVFYPLLDVGLRVPFSTGTDWSVGDLSRVYLPLGAGWTREDWLAQLRAGRSFITNGPLLELEVAGEGPGGVVRRDGPEAVAVRARAIGRVNFGALEVLDSGRVVARAEARAAGDHYEAEIASDVALEAPSWIAARVAPGDAESELGGPLFAHTTAVTVEIAGEAPFRSDVARALVLEMDWNARKIRADSKFADEAQLEAVTAPYREAIDTLSARLSWRDRIHAWLVRALRTLRDWLGVAPGA